MKFIRSLAPALTSYFLPLRFSADRIFQNTVTFHWERTSQLC